MATEIDGEGQGQPVALPQDPYERVLAYQGELTAFFTGSSMEANRYSAMREDLTRNPLYAGLAPTFLKRNRDTASLWTFAKSVNSSWEPRRQFIREQFEPLLDFLERSGLPQAGTMPGGYDSNAWTGVQDTVQQARAVKTLVPVTQAAIEVLIQHLEQRNHNGGPPLDEVEEAIGHLRNLHAGLGRLLTAAESGKLTSTINEGLVGEIARYGRRAARTLKNDPVPYALSGLLLAVCTACGIPGLGGYLGGIATAMRKPAGS